MNLSDLIIKEQSKYKIYCDMDGVLTDFSGDFIRLAKQLNNVVSERDDVPNNAAARFEKKYGTEAFWKVVETGGLKFWSDMSWNVGGKKLWSYISKHDTEILSAPSKRVLETCIKGKKMWVKRLGSPKVNFRSKDRKKEFATKNSILIDDLKSNIIDWNNSGGIGVHHKSTSETIGILKELGI